MVKFGTDAAASHNAAALGRGPFQVSLITLIQ